LLGWVRAGSRWPHKMAVASQPDDPVAGDYLPFPFFLAYAASYVKGNVYGAEVVLRDSIARRESYERFFCYIVEQKFDLIFIETATPTWAHDRALIRHIRELSPDSKVVVCGTITAAMGEQILKDEPVHACINGEYEKGAARVVRGESGLIGFDFLTAAEMNNAPAPMREKEVAHAYWDACPVGNQAPQLQWWTSRGCWAKCLFCAWPAVMTNDDPDGTHRRVVRQYNWLNMIGGIKRALADFPGFKSIYLDDDTFNLGDRHVEEACRVLAEVGLPWAAMCRADGIRRESWRLMRESGCFGVKLGFESGSQEVIDKIIHKNLNLEEARKTVFFLKDLGFTVHGTFTYGLPGETREQQQQTRNFRAALPLDSFQESGTITIEGTPMDRVMHGDHLSAYPSAKAP
jgi:hypothetical protein